MDWYYAAGNNVICPACYQQIAGGGAGAGFVRLLKAMALGIGGGLVGAAIWYTVRVLAKVEIGYIAIAVGALVGGGVELGSGNRGGRGYQLLAVFLTYLAVAADSRCISRFYERMGEASSDSAFFRCINHGGSER